MSKHIAKGEPENKGGVSARKAARALSVSFFTPSAAPCPRSITRGCTPEERATGGGGGTPLPVPRSPRTPSAATKPGGRGAPRGAPTSPRPASGPPWGRWRRRRRGPRPGQQRHLAGSRRRSGGRGGPGAAGVLTENGGSRGRGGVLPRCKLPEGRLRRPSGYQRETWLLPLWVRCG